MKVINYFSKSTSLIFWIPILIILFSLRVSPEANLYENPYFYYICFVLIDGGHVFTTPTVLSERFDGKFPLFFFVIVALFTLACMAPLVHFYPFTFIKVLGTFGLYHIISQQFGWLRSYQREHPAKTDNLESALFWAITLLPVLYWLNRYSIAPLRFFLKNDLPIINLFHRQTYYFLIIGFFLPFVILQLRDLKASKLVFLMSHVFWLYFGLVFTIFGEHFFRPVSNILHAIPYIFFLYKIKKNSSYENSGLLNIKLIFALILSFSLLWWGAFKILSLFKQVDLKYFLFIFYPTVTHYLLDSIIWAKRINFFKRIFSTRKLLALKSI